MLFLIIWGFFAYMTGKIAENKGLKPGPWYVAGALFGCFAMFIAMVQKPRSRYYRR